MHTHTPLEKTIGSIGVLLAAGNAVGGYVVTERMLEMFKSSGSRGGGQQGATRASHRQGGDAAPRTDRERPAGAHREAH